MSSDPLGPTASVAPHRCLTTTRGRACSPGYELSQPRVAGAGPHLPRLGNPPMLCSSSGRPGVVAGLLAHRLPATLAVSSCLPTHTSLPLSVPPVSIPYVVAAHAATSVHQLCSRMVNRSASSPPRLRCTPHSPSEPPPCHRHASSTRSVLLIDLSLGANS